MLGEVTCGCGASVPWQTPPIACRPVTAGQISGQEGPGLLAIPSMRTRRAPGSTGPSALSGVDMGTTELTYNDSKVAAGSCGWPRSGS